MNGNSALRTIETDRRFSVKRFFLQWEWMLAAILVLVNVINSNASPNYRSAENIMSAMQVFLDKGIMVFPMMLVILLGDIDISVASTMALSGVVMGVAYNAGMPMELAILLALVTGAACGAVNGAVLIKFPELSFVIVTISTMIIFRGIASIILEDTAAGGFPDWYRFFGWGRVGNVPFILLFVAAQALVFGWVIHKTKLGRRIYAMGQNPVTSRFSGIQTDKIKLAVFTLNGLFAAVAGVFLVSKTSSVRPSIGLGYELDVIAMVVLGGVSTAGGRGRVLGVVLSIFIIGLLRYGLGLVNIPSQTIMIIVGALLIMAVAIPNIKLLFTKQ